MSAAEGTEFRIDGATAEHECVEGWSTSRLPSEPAKVAARRWLPEFRTRLRQEIQKLAAAPGEMLIAQFASDETGLFDVENLLLDNVGLDAFRRSGQDGVRFERRDWAWAPIALEGAHCYHRYALRPARDTTGSGVLASWSGVPLDAFGRDPGASVAWLALRTAEVDLSTPLTSQSRFAVHLTLDVPAGSNASAVQLLKPLLDGTISAFHDYRGEDLDRMSLRLRYVQITAGALWHAPKHAAYGDRIDPKWRPSIVGRDRLGGTAGRPRAWRRRIRRVGCA